MRRAIQLALQGSADTSPNPMVGAVIVGPDGTVVGEGWHRRCGEGHAEVNAVAQVADKSVLKDSTIYVTLEPCAHYGKTPPCAVMLAECGIRRVVIGMTDPHDVVAGRGVEILRKAGAEVITGVLEQECRAINPHFVRAHTSPYPFVTLKWAQSTDGWLDAEREASEGAVRFSTPLTTQLVHRLRSLHDAIMVGSGTVLLDNPRLDVRGFDGRQPLKVVIDRRGRVPATAKLFETGRMLVLSAIERPDLAETGAEVETVDADEPIDGIMKRLRSRGVTSVLVEGGASLHNSLIEAGLWNEARIETAPFMLGDKGRGHVDFNGCAPVSTGHVEDRMINTYRNKLTLSSMSAMRAPLRHCLLAILTNV